jgi:hypothetical protein
MSEALGRRYSFSVSGMAATAPDMRVRLKSLSKRWQRRHSTSLGGRASVGGNSRASSLLAAAEDEAERARVENLEDLVGTALVLAYLQVTQLMPVMELAQCCSLAVKHFEHCRTPSGWSFTHMRITFLTLISPGILNVKSTWLVRARIWKCILGQSTEGWWDANHSAAFVLEARPPEEMERLTPTLITRISDFIRGAAQALTEEDEEKNGGHVLTEAIASARTSVAGTTLKEDDKREMVGRSSVRGDEEKDGRATDATVFDCPLTNSPASITATVPRVLRALNADDASINVARVWTTMCCISLLERQRVAWLWVSGDACSAFSQ